MKILLAVDDSNASEKAVRHIGEIFGGGRPKAEVTLYHAMESLPEYLVSRISGPQQSDEVRGIVKDWVAHAGQTARELLAKHRQTLVDAGIPAEAIDTKITEIEAMPGSQKVVAAVAIIDEMKNGKYQIVCMGRRGSSGMISVFPGSVAEKVLRQATGITVWIVD